MTYIQNFSQPPGETSHDYTLCFSTAAAASPPSASHPRRPRLDAAALRGSGRPCRRGRAADLCGGHGGRGQRKRPWPRKGFRVVFGVALTRWRKGFVHWQLIFVLCFGMLSGIRSTCCLNPLFVMGWASWNSGKRNEMKRVENRRNHVFFNMILSLIPHLSLKLHRCVEQIWTAELSDILNIYDLYSEFWWILPNHPEKHPIATLCFSMAAAAAPPSASHPRRPRRDAAAYRGWERPRRRGRAADLCGVHGGRGRQRRPWPWKGFRVVLGVALTRW